MKKIYKIISHICICFSAYISGACTSSLISNSTPIDGISVYVYTSEISTIPTQRIPNTTLQAGEDHLYPLDLGGTLNGRVLVGEDDIIKLYGTINFWSQEELLLNPSSAIKYSQKILPSSDGFFEINLPSDVYIAYYQPDNLNENIPPQIIYNINFNPLDEKLIYDIKLTTASSTTITLEHTQDLSPLSDLDLRCYDSNLESLSSQVHIDSTLKSEEIENGIYNISCAQGVQNIYVLPKNDPSSQLFSIKKLDPLDFSSEMSDLYNITADIQQTGKIRGKVAYDQKDSASEYTSLVSTVYILCKKEESETRYNSITGTCSKEMKTDENGNFELTLEKGNYKIIIKPDWSQGKAFSGTEIDNIEVKENETIIFSDIMLKKVKSISGTIETPSKNPIESVQINFISKSGENLSTSTFTDSNGIFNTKLGLGKYWMQIIPPINSSYSQKTIEITPPENILEQEAWDIGSTQLSLGGETVLQFKAQDYILNDGSWIEIWKENENNSVDFSPANLLFSGYTDKTGELRIILPLNK